MTRARKLLAGAAAAVAVAAIGYYLWITGPGERGPDTIYNEQTVEIMRRVMAPDANGVDVGAYEGTLTAPMAEIAPRGHVFAVEPQPKFAAALRQKFAAVPAVRVVEAALGDTVGTTDFTLALDDPARSGFGPQDYPSAHERTQHITVAVTCLDSVVTAATPIAFIKIDVEGGEYRVLRGARATIRRDHPVIAFEYGAAGRFYNRVTPQMMWALLHDDLGLDLALMKTWLEGGPSYTREQFLGAVAGGADWMYVAYPSGYHGRANQAPAPR